MRNIILTGFMGTGKSSVGKALARMTGMEFIDLDAIIMAVAGQTINEIFSLQGESSFSNSGDCRSAQDRTARQYPALHRRWRGPCG
jgi:shikimate kinase